MVLILEKCILFLCFNEKRLCAKRKRQREKEGKTQHNFYIKYCICNKHFYRSSQRDIFHNDYVFRVFKLHKMNGIFNYVLLHPLSTLMILLGLSVTSFLTILRNVGKTGSKRAARGK